MKTTLTTSVLTAVSLLGTIYSSQGGNLFPPNAQRPAATVGTPAGPCLPAPKAQVSGNGRSVTLGADGKLRCSTDGIEWSPAYLPVESFLRGMAFGNGQFVAVGGSYATGTSVILTSVNGRSWNLAANPSKQVLHGVAYSGDRFIAVGAGGTILTSKSGNVGKGKRPAPTPPLLPSPLVMEPA